MTVDALRFRSWPGNFECSGEPGLSWDLKDELEGLIKGGCLGVESRRKDRAVGRSSAGRGGVLAGACCGLEQGIPAGQV